jgi:ribose-phosphate pyrophosphokinase
MTVLFAFPGYEQLARNINAQLGCVWGDIVVRHFPDGESLVRIDTVVKSQDVMVVCGLDRPDQKAMALMFFAAVARELGAMQVGLIAPYLGYMRQDARFHAGEAITSKIFARFLSSQVDWLVTIDPHLHRHKSLDAIYAIPCHVLHAAETIAIWIRDHIEHPVLIGPDEESAQWVADIAEKAGAPWVILTKIRHGDREVEVSMPEVDIYHDHTPVLVDDIISTARTMIATVQHVYAASMPPPVCIGVHAVFAEESYTALQDAGVAQVVTCNTIPHVSNAIDMSALLSESIQTIRPLEK